MGYYVRAFCTSDKKPTIRQVLDHINQSGHDFIAQTNLTDSELSVDTWTSFELTYKKDRLPILVECNHINDDDGLAKEEINEFIDDLGPAGFFAGKKKKVIQHLQTCKYIITNQLATSDFEDIGYDANGEFLKYFVSNHGGLIHADGEGFYEGTDVIVETK